jgi:hypothetical protein
VLGHNQGCSRLLVVTSAASVRSRLKRDYSPAYLPVRNVGILDSWRGAGLSRRRDAFADRAASEDHWMMLQYILTVSFSASFWDGNVPL